ncbi:MAG: putative diguanylate cyclase AdrA [Syntrophorhabdus sp. PtaU1.Bin058]|nr:MAG: putative diguanylate cyclase AdrA [Syntrophorhabdus sp. PtaU1.Bin058]
MENHEKAQEQLIKELAGMRRRVADLERSEAKYRQIEKALQESEAKYRSIFENSVEAICQTTREGNILMANPVFFRTLGYDSYDEMARSITNVYNDLYVNPEDRQRIMEVVKQYGAAGRFRTQFYKKDGSKIWVSFSIWSVHDAQGKFLYYQSMGEDITELKAMEDALRKSEQECRGIFENAVMGIFRTSKDGHYLMINPAGARMYGYGSPEEMMQSVTDMAHQIYVRPEDRKTVTGLVERNGFIEDYEVEHYTKDGGTIWASVNARVVRDATDAILYYETISQDITERKRLEQRLSAMSITDELTGLYNRRGFLTLTQQQLKIETRAKQDMLLFFTDLDNMKQINDTLGHKEGDRALIDVAGIFKETFRESDIIGRMGGDEFAVFAINTTDETQKILTTRLQNNLDTFNDRSMRPYKLFLSIGVAHYDPETPSSIDELITRADTLMYEQKKGKRHFV